MASWKIQAIKSLSAENAVRVFGRDELNTYLKQQGIDIPLRTLLRGLQEWEQAGIVERVTQGVYLNSQQNFPLVTPSEAAQMLRPGAVLSLHYVLGNAGVLNNPSHWVTAVLPGNGNKAATEVPMDNGLQFRFAYLQEDFCTNLGSDAFDPFATVPTASAEKALLDVLHLSSSPRGSKRWSLPPSHDWDLDGLDQDKLGRLAAQLRMEEPLNAFVNGVESSHPKVKVPRR